MVRENGPMLWPDSGYPGRPLHELLWPQPLRIPRWKRAGWASDSAVRASDQEFRIVRPSLCTGTSGGMSNDGGLRDKARPPAIDRERNVGGGTQLSRRSPGVRGRRANRQRLEKRNRWRQRRPHRNGEGVRVHRRDIRDERLGERLGAQSSPWQVADTVHLRAGAPQYAGKGRRAALHSLVRMRDTSSLPEFRGTARPAPARWSWGTAGIPEAQASSARCELAYPEARELVNPRLAQSRGSPGEPLLAARSPRARNLNWRARCSSGRWRRAARVKPAAGRPRVPRR